MTIMRTLSSISVAEAAWAVGLGVWLAIFGVSERSHGQVVYRVQGAQFYDLADDGTAIGLQYPPADVRMSITWTAAGGVTRWGSDPTIPGTWNQGSAISGDGSTYFGYVEDGANKGTFRYRGPGTYQFIANLFGRRNVLTRSSRDGNAAVGYWYNPAIPFSNHTAVRWTPQRGIEVVGIGGFDSEATDIGADGNTIVGKGAVGEGRAAAWVWTAAGGSRKLDDLPGTGAYGSEAYAVTGDGSVIAGTSGGTGYGEAVIWRRGIIESLGTIDGYIQGTAISISDDASIITGRMYDIVSGTGDVGFVWTRERGMETSEAFFARLGITTLPTGIAQSRRWHVSAGGTMLYLEGDGGYVVTIPTPGAAFVILSALFPRSARRRRAGLQDRQRDRLGPPQPRQGMRSASELRRRFRVVRRGVRVVRVGVGCGDGCD